MDIIKILKRGPISRNGIYDAAVSINNKDCGILYVNEKEKELLLQLINKGKYNLEDVEFETDLFPEDAEDDDI